MANVILTHWVSVFGTPGVITDDKGPRFTGAIVPHFCRDRNVSLQAVIPGLHQSLGPAEERHRYLKDTTQQIIGGRKRKNVLSKDWQGYASMCTMRLNSQVQQYGGFSHGRRFFRNPDITARYVWKPTFKDSIYKMAPRA